MGKSRRSRRGRNHDEPPAELDFDRLRSGWRRQEVKRGRTWNVQPVTETRALKTYTCPGCGRTIDVGVAHLVAWRADGVLGDDSDLAARRHWHDGCWKVA